ncbi:odorant receptor 82a-like [Leptopilina boulardi]|uniref:odorant receptor 82a-like n=1 Tax=Leptopilina boulardi TaxID=63433 RepID=UPI0021F606A5|nr:odorant receptor 82a-like [Leptopilina boulardi]
MSDDNRGKIYTGQKSFTCFKFCGVWEQPKCTTRWKLIFYRIYSFCIVTMYFIFTCSICMHLFQKHKDNDAFSQSLFYSSTFVMSFIKIVIILKKREIFMKTQEMLMSEVCRPQDHWEVEILFNYSLKGRKLSFYHLIGVHISGTMVLMLPLTSLSNISLPIPCWIPFSFESKFVFSLLYLQQIICVFVVVNINGGMETLAMSILLQMCGQLEILMYRFDSLSKLPQSNNNKLVNCYHETEITKRCIKNHLHLYAISENISKQFGSLIIMQFFASMILICIIIYNLSKMSLTNEHSWLMISYASSFTLQIFIYCYFGHQMTDKSSEIGTAIYFINWHALTLKTKKSLIIIMMRSARPIKLIAVSVIVMSLETFMKIIKTSYTGYNLLKN